jgi:hypothetical protein
MGKARRRREVEQEVLAVDTFGGRVQLRWEEQSSCVCQVVQFGLSAMGLVDRCRLIHGGAPAAPLSHAKRGAVDKSCSLASCGQSQQLLLLLCQERHVEIAVIFQPRFVGLGAQRQD